MTVEGGKPDFFSLLGLAHRAGTVARGMDAARRAVRQGEARLVVLATDASEAQLDKIRKLLDRRSVPVVRTGTRSRLGAALGSAPLSAVAVTRASFAEQLVHRASEPSEDPGDGSEHRR